MLTNCIVFNLISSISYSVSIHSEMIKNAGFSEDGNKNHHREEQENRFDINPSYNFRMSWAIVEGG
jgi:hypothetical protein